MTDQLVGSCGYTLIGANVILFIGSLYSNAQEKQAIGTYPPFQFFSNLPPPLNFTDILQDISVDPGK